MDGYQCDNCGSRLYDDEFDGSGSWSYTCKGCGFHYNHSSRKTAEEQVEEFNESKQSDD